MSARIEEIRGDLCARLRDRRGEIEQAAWARIHSVSDSGESPDPEYADGLRAAVTAALEYGIEAVERSEDRPPPIPTLLLAQARLAARHGVKLETVLRRYLAGYTLLGDFIIEESERAGPLSGDALKRLLRVQAALLDRLIAAVSEEYGREAADRHGTSEQRHTERVERLLAGELIDIPDLAYDFQANHLGAIATGPGATDAIRDLAARLDRLLLIVPRSDDTTWAWFGGRRPLTADDLWRFPSSTWPARVALAVGEPGQGLAGWRLTHRQAAAALPIARRDPTGRVRYADVALFASTLQDDLLTASLHELYLDPLATGRDGGEALRQTLRAFFKAERNVSSAAALLGVRRHTVTNRLRVIEERLGRPLSACAADLEAALRLQELDDRQRALAHLPGSNVVTNRVSRSLLRSTTRGA